MNLYAEARSGALVVRVDEERLDAAIAIRFKDQMREVASQPSPRIILDMSRVEFLDSSGTVLYVEDSGGETSPSSFYRPRRVK